ncbi:hypothetical protein N431DRAFT_425721 [Stipitochalara longipes BDJ]|nr:hypothetical protein N431DRAFT_425721 [Stipitochalara longipes BDJ]
MTVEEAIKRALKGFLEKRRASDDSRLCGPHDLALVYEWVFRIEGGGKWRCGEDGEGEGEGVEAGLKV